MKSKILTITFIIVLCISLIGNFDIAEAGAYGVSFITSITYMNIGTGEATLVFTFYPSESGTPIIINRPNLPQFGASSLYVGGLTEITSPFKGSAIISSDQPIAATMVQLPQSSTVKNRPLSNGFSEGSAKVSIPTILKNTFSTNSIFSIQNIDSTGADLTVTFIPTSGSPVVDNVTNLPAGSAKYYDMGATSPISAASFNGSVTIASVQTGTSTDGAIVGSAMELSTATTGVYAFEGVSSGSNTIYMPSAFCNFGSASDVNSAFAVQNVNTTITATVTVSYTVGGTDGPYDVGPGKKRSFIGCAVNSAGYIGAATIGSSGGEIVAIGKIGGGGLSTAYNGFASGSQKVAVPYVRWTESSWTTGARQRVNIAIQNVGSSTISAGQLSVKYYDLNGTLQGTITNPADILVGGKWSTNASTANAEFGYVGGTGGGAIIEGPSGAEVAVVARAATYLTSTSSAGEDFNGLPIP